MSAEGAALEAPPRTEWEGHQDSGVHAVTLLGSKDSMRAWRVSHLMSTKPDTQNGGFGVMAICSPGTVVMVGSQTSFPRARF